MKINEYYRYNANAVIVGMDNISIAFYLLYIAGYSYLFLMLEESNTGANINKYEI